MKLVYRVLDQDNELFKGNKAEVTSWLESQFAAENYRIDIDATFRVVKVGGSESVSQTPSQFLGRSSKKYAVITDFGTVTEVIFSSNSKDEIVEWLKAQNDVRGMMVVNSGGPIGDRTKTVEDFLRQNIIPEIFSQVVPKFYAMDPETEDMIPNGRYLANGMRVLIADPDCRERPEEIVGTELDWRKYKMLERNRWCTVSHVDISSNDNRSVSFVAVYEDGSKHQYVMGISKAWLVKSDSIVESNQKAIEDHAKVQEAMTAAVKVVTGEASDDEKADQLTDTIRKTSTQILGTIG